MVRAAPSSGAVLMLFVYVGDTLNHGEGPHSNVAYGYVFEKNGIPVNVESEFHIRKFLGNRFFRRVEETTDDVVAAVKQEHAEKPKTDQVTESVVEHGNNYQGRATQSDTATFRSAGSRRDSFRR